MVDRWIQARSEIHIRGFGSIGQVLDIARLLAESYVPLDQAASDKLDKICILYYIGYKTERKIYDTINNISQR